MRKFTELAPVPDIFVSGLADAEYLGGGNIRLTYYRERRQLHGLAEGGEGRESELEVILCLVTTIAAWEGMRAIAGAALAEAQQRNRLEKMIAHPTVS